MIDFESGARVAGAGFYFLKNDAVLLELALQQFAVQLLVKNGFVPVSTPDVANTHTLHGIGFIPRGPETQIYSIENTDLNLVATAEITLGGMYSVKSSKPNSYHLSWSGLATVSERRQGLRVAPRRGFIEFTNLPKSRCSRLPSPTKAMRYTRS